MNIVYRPSHFPLSLAVCTILWSISIISTTVRGEGIDCPVLTVKTYFFILLQNLIRLQFSQMPFALEPLPNDHIYICSHLVDQLSNVIRFGLVTNGRNPLAWIGLACLKNTKCCFFGLVPNAIISFGPICFVLAGQLPN